MTRRRPSSWLAGERGTVVWFAMNVMGLMACVALVLPIGFATVLRARTATAADAAAIAAGVDARAQLIETFARPFFPVPHVYSEERLQAAAAAYALDNDAVIVDFDLDGRVAFPGQSVHVTVEVCRGGTSVEARASASLTDVDLVELEDDDREPSLPAALCGSGLFG